MAAGTISLVAVLRDARKSALLRTRLKDDIDVMRTMETLCSCLQPVYSRMCIPAPARSIR